MLNGRYTPCIYISIHILTDVAPIRNANILVIDVTVIETPADFSDNATRSVAGSLLSAVQRLSIDYQGFDHEENMITHSQRFI